MIDIYCALSKSPVCRDILFHCLPVMFVSLCSVVAVCTCNSEVCWGTGRHHIDFEPPSMHSVVAIFLVVMCWEVYPYSSGKIGFTLEFNFNFLWFVSWNFLQASVKSKESSMAQYKGAASEAGRAMQLMKKREKEREQLEQLKQKIAEVCNLCTLNYNMFVFHGV